MCKCVHVYIYVLVKFYTEYYVVTSVLLLVQLLSVWDLCLYLTCTCRVTPVCVCVGGGGGGGTEGLDVWIAVRKIPTLNRR